MPCLEEPCLEVLGLEGVGPDREAVAPARVLRGPAELALGLLVARAAALGHPYGDQVAAEQPAEPGRPRGRTRPRRPGPAPPRGGAGGGRARGGAGGPRGGGRGTIPTPRR